MASTKLSDYEVERNRLPDLCMRCGEPATMQKSRNFRWCPPWATITILAGLLPYVIVSMVLTKYKRVQVPLCDQHRGHWWVRGLIIFLGFLCLLALMVTAIAFSADEYGVLPAILWSATGIAFFGWLVLIIVLQYTVIRPSEITDRGITLCGVSKTFADAVRDQRDRLGDDEYFDRPSRRRRRNDDDDDDRRPRRRSEQDERISDRDLPRGRPRRERDDEED
jgi:hypothetical protein